MSFTASVLVRVLMIAHHPREVIPDFDVRALEQRLEAATRRWEDDLPDRAGGAPRRGARQTRCGSASQRDPAAYREDVPPRNAVADLDMAARTLADDTLGMHLYQPLEGAAFQAVPP